MILGLAVSSFSTDDVDNTPLPMTSTLSIDLNGLENLGDAFLYEGWVVVGGVPLTTGTFVSASRSDEAASFQRSQSWSYVLM